MQLKRIAECSKGSILQYFWPSLRCHLSLRPVFCLFMSGRLRHVLLYLVSTIKNQEDIVVNGGEKDNH